MDCSKAQELLSPYYDDEISGEVCLSLAEHVDRCRHCGETLSVFQELSALTRGLDDPEPPDSIWPRITLGLDAETANAGVDAPAGRLRRVSRRWRVSLLATATLVMIATGVVWITPQTWRGPGHDHQLTADFGEYLEHFPNSPDGAQQILLAKYGGQAVSLSQAARHLGYRPTIASGLPERYSLDGVYVLKMPCCTCVQTIYRRDDGAVLAVFEHDEKQPIWFGDRPRIRAQFGGRPCDVVQLQGRLAASWKEGRRYLTIVGLHDLDEMVLLIRCFKAIAPRG